MQDGENHKFKIVWWVPYNASPFVLKKKPSNKWWYGNERN